MKRSPHIVKHGIAMRRSRRRRLQLKAIRRGQSKRRLIYFRSENIVYNFPHDGVDYDHSDID